MVSQQEGVNRINIKVRGQEMVASGEITQEQLNESLRIFEKTKSMDAVNEYMQNQKKV